MVRGAVDVETGGLDHKVHPILAIGIQPLGFDLDPLYLRVKADPTRCDAEALAVNHLDPTEGLELGEAKAKLIEYIVSNTVRGAEYKLHPVGQNFGGFDALFLREFMGFKPYREFVSYRFGDTQALALALCDAGIIEPKSIKLDHLLEYFGITNAQPHHALSDATAEAKLWNAMIKILKDLKHG